MKMWLIVAILFQCLCANIPWFNCSQFGHIYPSVSVLVLPGFGFKERDAGLSLLNFDAGMFLYLKLILFCGVVEGFNVDEMFLFVVNLKKWMMSGQLMSEIVLGRSGEAIAKWLFYVGKYNCY